MTIQFYLANSSLSNAAYADFNKYSNPVQALKNTGLTEEASELFLNQYRIVSQENDSISGIQVTLFEEIATGKTTTASLIEHTNRLCCFKL